MLISGKTRVGIAIPQMFFPDSKIDLSLVQRHVKLVESLGYDSGWVQDQALGTMQTLDPFALLAYASTHTTGLKLGVSVIVMPFRSPVHVAKISSTLDHMSGGRMILGVGIGGGQEKYGAFGITPEHRASRFEEQIVLLKRLWTESDIHFQGRFWQLNGVTVEPKPLQKPHLPLWFGADAEAALRRAARFGDGFMGAGASSIPGFKKALKKLRQFLEEEGKDPATYPTSKRLYIAVDRDKKGARERLRRWFAAYYYDADMADVVAVYGPEQEVIDRVGDLLKEGLDMIMFNPVYDLLEQPQRLAKEIVPKL